MDYKQYFKEYYQNHKDFLKKRTKEYYGNNRDRYIEYNKNYYIKKKEYLSEKINCDICGCQINRSNMIRHKKSKKHLKNKNDFNLKII